MKEKRKHDNQPFEFNLSLSLPLPPPSPFVLNVAQHSTLKNNKIKDNFTINTTNIKQEIPFNHSPPQKINKMNLDFN